jgi:hypothetical protein
MPLCFPSTVCKVQFKCFYIIPKVLKTWCTWVESLVNGTNWVCLHVCMRESRRLFGVNELVADWLLVFWRRFLRCTWHSVSKVVRTLWIMDQEGCKTKPLEPVLMKCHFSGRSKEKPWKFSIRKEGHRVENRNRDLPDKNRTTKHVTFCTPVSD